MRKSIIDIILLQKLQLIIGRTNIDGVGSEGIELTQDGLRDEMGACIARSQRWPD